MAYQFSIRSSVRRRSQKCVFTLGQDGTELHVDAHGQHSQKCVSTVGQDGTELHVDAHGQHSQKCVSTLGQDGTELHVDAHGKHSQKCVSTVGQDGTELHVNAHGQHSQKCVHCGLRRHAYGWFHTRDIWEASQTVSDQIQTERTTSKWFTICLMYMDLGSTLQCASTPVGPYWFHVPSWET